MPFKKRDKGPEGPLGRVAREVVRASAANEAEAEAAGSSPFLYSRVRAAIAAERRRREEAEWWRVALAVFWRAVPALAVVAGLAFVLSLFAAQGPGGTAARAALLSPDDVGVGGVMFAEGRSISSEDVLATILEEEETEGAR
jgi:hypothetical protein